MSDKIGLLDHLEISYQANAKDCTTDCLWCGSDNKLSISREEGNVFQCWSCKERGNGLSLMRKYYSLLPELTLSHAKEFVSLKPGIVPATLRDEGIRWDNGNFWIPVKNAEGNIIALHKYDTTTGIIYSSPKPFSCSILGLHRFKADCEEVWVAEGHADYFVLRHQLNRIPNPPEMLGTCGSGFSGSYLHLLSDKHVVLLFDNDDAGRTGVQSVARRIKSSGNNVQSLKYLDWSSVTVPQHSELPSGFDLRDLVNALRA